MRHSTKYHVKLLLFVAVFLGGLFLGVRSGFGFYSLFLAMLAGPVIFLLVWPEVWSQSEVSKRQVAAIKILQVPVLALILFACWGLDQTQ